MAGLSSRGEKLFNFSKFSASLASKGLPYSEVWAVLVTAIEVLGPIALILGAWSQWTAVALIAFNAFHHLDDLQIGNVLSAFPQSAASTFLQEPCRHGRAPALLREWAWSLQLAARRDRQPALTWVIATTFAVATWSPLEESVGLRRGHTLLLTRNLASSALRP
jgi:DoxX